MTYHTQIRAYHTAHVDHSIQHTSVNAGSLQLTSSDLSHSCITPVKNIKTHEKIYSSAQGTQAIKQDTDSMAQKTSLC